MTCIVGYIDKANKNVVMGADSAASAGCSVTIRKDPKIFKLDKFIIGCTSSYRMMQLIRFSFNPPPISTDNIFKYMCTDFINELRKCFTDGGYIQKYTDGDEKGGTFLVAYKNRLFKIQDDFQVSESLDNYDACGCGEQIALGSLFTSKRRISRDIVIDALKASSKFSLGVEPPFILHTT